MTEKILSGKTALITGAGRGIGLGCALALAKKGADIILNDRPGSPDLAAAAEKIHAQGVDCKTIEADIFSRNGAEQLIEKAQTKAGKTLEILVSNPALNRRGEFLSYDPETFESVINGTLTSGFHLGQLFSRHLVERGQGGKMVFISSVHGVMPLGHAIAYNAAKSGLEHMMRSMSVELVGNKINVNAIAPGWIDTPGEREVFSDETIKESAPQLPWGRLGLPEDIGNAAAFLCSDEADYITGVVLHVDGGFRFRDCAPVAMPEKG